MVRVRADTSVDSDAIPGVSMSVRPSSRRVGQYTSIRSISVGLMPTQVDVQRAAVAPEGGGHRGAAARGWMTTAGWSP